MNAIFKEVLNNVKNNKSITIKLSKDNLELWVHVYKGDKYEDYCKYYFVKSNAVYMFKCKHYRGAIGDSTILIGRL